MTGTAIPVVSDPIVASPLIGTAIVATPTSVAPLTAADGTTYIVQVMNPGSGTITPANAATWTHNADGSLDVYDGNAMLIASFPSGQWMNVQLVTT